MKSPKITATTLRIMLIMLVMLIIGLSTVGFYYAQDWLSGLEIASNIGSSKTTSGPTGDPELTPSQKTVATKVSGFTTPSEDYLTLIKQDLDKYASGAGVVITNYSPTATQQPTANGTGAPVSMGAQSSLVTVTLENPAKYTNIMKFIKAIETNLPKLQITGITIKNATASDDSVTIEPLIIEVYTK